LKRHGNNRMMGRFRVIHDEAYLHTLAPQKGNWNE